MRALAERLHAKGKLAEMREGVHSKNIVNCNGEVSQRGKITKSRKAENPKVRRGEGQS